MQNDFFKPDLFKIYQKLTDINFCRLLVKNGLDFMSDYLKMDLNEEHFDIAVGVIESTNKFNNKQNIVICSNDHKFLKIWKMCANRHLIRRKESIWKELMERKVVSEDHFDKLLFDLIYNASGKMYGWEE